jgi:hypothetical protein
VGLIGVLGACGARCCVEHVFPLVEALNRGLPQAWLACIEPTAAAGFILHLAADWRRSHALARGLLSLQCSAEACGSGGTRRVARRASRACSRLNGARTKRMQW